MATPEEVEFVNWIQHNVDLGDGLKLFPKAGVTLRSALLWKSGTDCQNQTNLPLNVADKLFAAIETWKTERKGEQPPPAKPADIRPDVNQVMEGIDHVVVLMLENRSFDAVLGWAYTEGSGGKVQYFDHIQGTNVPVSLHYPHLVGESKDPGNEAARKAELKAYEEAVKKEVPFYGLDFPLQLTDKPTEQLKEVDWLFSRYHSNPLGNQTHPARVWCADPLADGNPGRFGEMATFPPANPGEPHEHTKVQLYNTQNPDWLLPPPMSGFAADYQSELQNVAGVAGQDILTSLPFRCLPVLHTLARQYAVCDRWFASVPSQTWTNRLFSLTGTSHGVVNNELNDSMKPTRKHLETFPTRTIMAQLDEWHGGVDYDSSLHDRDSESWTKPNAGEWSWRAYTYMRDCDMVSTLFNLLFQHPYVRKRNYVQFGELERDATNGTLASFSIVEPQYVPMNGKDGPTYHNDHHPAELKEGKLAEAFTKPPIWLADKLVLTVYKALFGPTAKNPERTLLIITYDEHGGTYDHVPPPKATNPNNTKRNSAKDFSFQRLGVRVPAVFVSPKIQPGTVLRPPPGYSGFDHTSLIASLRKRWKLPHGGETPPLSLRDAYAAPFWHVFLPNPDSASKATRPPYAEMIPKLEKRLENLQYRFDHLKPDGMWNRFTSALTGLGRRIFHSTASWGVRWSSKLGIRVALPGIASGRDQNSDALETTGGVTMPEPDGSAKEWEEFLNKFLDVSSESVTAEEMYFARTLLDRRLWLCAPTKSNVAVGCFLEKIADNAFKVIPSKLPNPKIDTVALDGATTIELDGSVFGKEIGKTTFQLSSLTSQTLSSKPDDFKDQPEEIFVVTSVLRGTIQVLPSGSPEPDSVIGLSCQRYLAKQDPDGHVHFLPAEFPLRARLDLGLAGIKLAIVDTDSGGQEKDSLDRRLAREESPLEFPPILNQYPPSDRRVSNKSQDRKHPMKRALLIGVNVYKNYKSKNLSGCVNDVESMIPVMQKFGFDDVVVLQDERATGDAIRAWFEHFQIITQPQDVFALYFSGHGSTRLNPNKASRQSETLVPHDAERGGLTDIVDDYLSTVLWGFRSQHVHLILDCCHSGAGARDMNSNTKGDQTDPDPLTQNARSRVLDRSSEHDRPIVTDDSEERKIRPSISFGFGQWVTLAACANTETAVEDTVDGKQRGLFTADLVDALTDANPLTSWQTVFARVRMLMTRKNVKQRPQLEGLRSYSVFGSRALSEQPCLRVTVNKAKELVLPIGSVAGVGRGSKWALRAIRQREDQKEKAQPLVLATAVNVTGLRSILKPDAMPSRSIEADQEFLAFCTTDYFGQRDEVFLQFDGLPANVQSEAENLFLSSLVLRTTRDPSTTRIVANKDALQLVYRGLPLPRLDVRGDPTSMLSSVVRNLESVAWCQRLLKSELPISKLQLKLEVSVLVPAFENGTAALKSLDVSGPVTVQEGDCFRFQVACSYQYSPAPEELFLTVLELRSDSKVSVLYPPFGTTISVREQFELPEGSVFQDAEIPDTAPLDKDGCAVNTYRFILSKDLLDLQLLEREGTQRLAPSFVEEAEAGAGAKRGVSLKAFVDLTKAEAFLVKDVQVQIRPRLNTTIQRSLLANSVWSQPYDENSLKSLRPSIDEMLKAEYAYIGDCIPHEITPELPAGPLEVFGTKPDGVNVVLVDGFPVLFGEWKTTNGQAWPRWLTGVLPVANVYVFRNRTNNRLASACELLQKELVGWGLIGNQRPLLWIARGAGCALVRSALKKPELMQRSAACVFFDDLPKSPKNIHAVTHGYDCILPASEPFEHKSVHPVAWSSPFAYRPVNQSDPLFVAIASSLRGAYTLPSTKSMTRGGISDEQSVPAEDNDGKAWDAKLSSVRAQIGQVPWKATTEDLNALREEAKLQIEKLKPEFAQTEPSQYSQVVHEASLQCQGWFNRLSHAYTLLSVQYREVEDRGKYAALEGAARDFSTDPTLGTTDLDKHVKVVQAARKNPLSPEYARALKDHGLLLVDKVQRLSPGKERSKAIENAKWFLSQAAAVPGNGMHKPDCLFELSRIAQLEGDLPKRESLMFEALNTWPTSGFQVQKCRVLREAFSVLVNQPSKQREAVMRLRELAQCTIVAVREVPAAFQEASGRLVQANRLYNTGFGFLLDSARDSRLGGAITAVELYGWLLNFKGEDTFVERSRRLQGHFADVDIKRNDAAEATLGVVWETVQARGYEACVDFCWLQGSSATSQDLPQQRLVAFVVLSSRDVELVVFDATSIRQISKAIQRFRAEQLREARSRSVRIPADFSKLSSACKGAAAELDAFWTPICIALHSRKKVVLCPDGLLCFFPFGAIWHEDDHDLTVAGPGHYLIDEYTFAYVSSMRDWSLPVLGKPTSGVAVFCNPDYNATVFGTNMEEPSKFKRLERLPATEIEVSPLGVTPIVGAKATVNAVKKVKNPLVLHLATHGFLLRGAAVEPSEPVLKVSHMAMQKAMPNANSSSAATALDDSGLAFAGANLSAGGILEAKDVTNMALAGTELVVLSACDTGTGAAVPGQGVQGLARAAMVAGARTVVSSLWPVPDGETAQLMIDFYGTLMAGGDRDEALREAMLKLKKKRDDPYFWAAFTLQGEPGSIPGLVKQSANPSATGGPSGRCAMASTLSGATAVAAPVSRGAASLNASAPVMPTSASSAPSPASSGRKKKKQKK